MAARVFLQLARPLQNVITRQSTELRHCERLFFPACSIHTSPVNNGFMEFFDFEENWGKKEVKTGRPWKTDELRLKSNSDLHKLWYILLKERNMIMTMEAEYNRQCELFPNPQRLEKVEESMENLLDVVAERDRALKLLETGKTGEPQMRWSYNLLGLGHWRREKEHYQPIENHYGFRATEARNGAWQTPFKRLLREKKLNAKRAWEKRFEKRLALLREKFPEADLEEEYEQLEKSKQKHLP